MRAIDKWEVVPRHWPPRHNACTDPCDMIAGACACGATHYLAEPWVQEYIAAYGRGVGAGGDA